MQLEGPDVKKLRGMADNRRREVDGAMRGGALFVFYYCPTV